MQTNEVLSFSVESGKIPGITVSHADLSNKYEEVLLVHTKSAH